MKQATIIEMCTESQEATREWEELILPRVGARRRGSRKVIFEPGLAE